MAVAQNDTRLLGAADRQTVCGAPEPEPEITKMTAPSPLFELEGIRLVRESVTVLHDLTAAIPHAEITALIGPSGSGKTSMLRLLNRLDDPDSGTVRYQGTPITQYPVGALRRRVGFVFQQPAMFTGTVADNLRVAVELGGPEAAAIAPSFEEVLTSVELPRLLLDRDASRLSGGEQQRVSIARALMTRPEVLLLDEPTSALDPEVAERLLNSVVHLLDEYGIPVVMVTHRLGEARMISTFTILLEGGSVVEAGPTEELFTAPAHERTRAYLALAE